METQTHKVEHRCCSPINRMAAMGMRRNDTELKVMRECPTLHPETFRMVSGRLKIRKPDITGYKRGRMTIVGFVSMGHTPKNPLYADCINLNDSHWAARCDCGMYELRRYGNFLKGFLKGIDDCCDNCYDPNGPKFEATKGAKQWAM
jgi:hypothetical protein